jgi:hypothetical protein
MIEGKKEKNKWCLDSQAFVGLVLVDWSQSGYFIFGAVRDSFFFNLFSHTDLDVF